MEENKEYYAFIGCKREDEKSATVSNVTSGSPPAWAMLKGRDASGIEIVQTYNMLNQE